jgi:hypothetical protein
VEGVEDQASVAGTDLVGGETPDHFVDGVWVRMSLMTSMVLFMSTPSLGYFFAQEAEVSEWVDSEAG